MVPLLKMTAFNLLLAELLITSDLLLILCEAFFFFLSHVVLLFGEGNGNPLQYSCLENPMDGGGLVGCSTWGS